MICLFRCVILVLYILKLCFFSQYVVHPFTDAMRKIGKVIGEFIYKKIKHDKTINLNSFNNSVLITYLPDVVFPEHLDVTYTKNGEYDAIKNSQAGKTVSAILVVGDTRRLDSHLYKQGVKK